MHILRIILLILIILLAKRLMFYFKILNCNSALFFSGFLSISRSTNDREAYTRMRYFVFTFDIEKYSTFPLSYDLHLAL